MRRDSRALVAGAAGIGDILRITPLVQVLHIQGYRVDMLIAPDQMETLELLRPRPEIETVYHIPSPICSNGWFFVDGLAEREYDIAVFSRWAAPLRSLVKSKKTLVLGRLSWSSHGDGGSVKHLASQLGHVGPLPQMLAAPSARRFGLDPGTVVVAPGCKPEYSWKRWHGVPELCRRLPRVVLVGTQRDIEESGTYFSHAPDWHKPYASFIGALSLPDTAALVAQSRACIAMDSGLMHLAAAVGTPTIGVFGPTDPVRELVESACIQALDCRGQCQLNCRVDENCELTCDAGLACLRRTTCDEVLQVLATLFQDRPQDASSA